MFRTVDFLLFIYPVLYQIKATRPRNMRTRPMLHEAEAEATKFGLEATSASRT